MATHAQIWVKVNATVDAGVAELVELLNRVDDLRPYKAVREMRAGVTGMCTSHAGIGIRCADSYSRSIGPALKRKSGRRCNDYRGSDIWTMSDGEIMLQGGSYWDYSIRLEGSD